MVIVYSGLCLLYPSTPDKERVGPRLGDSSFSGAVMGAYVLWEGDGTRIKRNIFESIKKGELRVPLSNRLHLFLWMNK